MRKNAFYRHPVTLTLITLSCLVSLITWFGQLETTMWFTYHESLIKSGQIWRVITPIFLHFPAIGIIFAHLAFNMIWLYQFGTAIEEVESSGFLILLVLVAGAVSNIAQGMVTMAIFGGMSGVVYALLGYLFITDKLSSSHHQRVPNNIAYFLIVFMLIAMTGLLGIAIANTAHVIGFIVGIVFAVLRYLRYNR